MHKAEIGEERAEDLQQAWRICENGAVILFALWNRTPRLVARSSKRCYTILMKLFCRKCANHFAVEDEYAGYEVQCPHCGATWTAPTNVQPTKRIAPIRMGSKTVRTPQTRYSQQYTSVPPQEDNSRLCFWLGLLLWLFGLLIAAIIGKGKGVIEAIKGMLVSVGIIIGIIILLNVIWFLFWLLH